MVTIPRAEERIRQPALSDTRAFVSAPRDFIGPAAEQAAAITGRAAQQTTQTVTRAVTTVADTLQTLQERDELEEMKSAQFKAQSALVDFETDQTLFARDALANAPDGAFGYTSYVTENFTKQAQGFLKSVPEQLKPEFDAKLQQLEQSLILNADKIERTARVDFYTQKIENGLETLIDQYMTSDIDYRDMTARGKELVRTADIPQDMMQKFYDGWRKEAVARKMEKLARDDPAQALVALGDATPQETLKTKMGELFAAIIATESSGNPDAVSPKGAVGLMQVRPSTARDIAKELRDPSFPVKGTNAEITEYLKQPEVNMAYGQHYFSKQLRSFNNDVEAALIAYNAGPENAKKWLKADRNYAVLPKPQETVPYVQTIMAQLGAEPTQTYVFGKNFVNAGDFRSRNYSWANLRNDRFRNAQMDASAVAALDDVTDAFGHGPLRITSGYRSHEHNSKVSFTKRSRHVEGDAFDIDVSGYSDEEKSRLLALFVSAGARGLGHYDNDTIHIDFRPGQGSGPGGLALWYGKNKNYQKGEAWFSDGVQHGLSIEGRSLATAPGVPTDPDLALLSYDDRQQIAMSIRETQKTQRVAQQNTAVDNYKLAMLYEPDKITETDILDDDRIYDNGVKASVITALRTAKKSGMELAAFQSVIAASGKANPLDSKHRKYVDQIWGNLNIATDNPQYGAQAIELTRQTGIAPRQITHGVRRAMTADWQNPETVSASSAYLDVASSILADTPDAFIGQDGSSQIKNAAAAYARHLELGYSPEEATRIVLRSEDKQWVSQVKDLRKQAQEGADKIDVGVIEQMFDDVFGPGGEPIVGYGDPRRQALLVSNARDVYTEEFLNSGDAEVATARMEARMQSLYGITSFGGEDYLMKYPPEQSGYPEIAGSHSYIYDQAVQVYRENIIGEVDPQRVVLTAIPGITDADVRAGRAPRYGILYQTTDGVWESPPGSQYFVVDVAAAVAADNEKIRVTPEQAALFEAELDRRFEPVTRTDIVMQLLDGEVTGNLFEAAKGGITLDTGETLIRAVSAKTAEPVIIDPETRVIYDYDERTGAFTPTDRKYTRGVIVRPSGAPYYPGLARKALTPENWKALVAQQLKARNDLLTVRRTEAITQEEQRRRELTPEQQKIEMRIVQENKTRRDTGAGYPTVRGVAVPRDIPTLERIREEATIPLPFGVR